MPLEHHRRVGRANGTKKANGDPLPKPLTGEIVRMPQAGGLPEFPPGLGERGQEMWRSIWQEGITWISKTSDMDAAKEAAYAADDLAAARTRYRATTDPSDARALVTLGKRFDEALSALAMTPASRSRLGVAEVVAVSKLEALRRRSG